MPLLLALICLLSAVTASAQGAAINPYEARVPVSDQTAPLREAALREALRIVVSRVGGETAPAQAASVVDEAARLVQRYGYERLPDGMLQLVAAFDARAVDSRLKALGLPVWGVYAAAVEELQLRVSGIGSAADYARVVGGLAALSNVRDVSPMRAHDDVLELRVRAEGGAGRLNGALLASGLLVPDAAGTAELSYRLEPAR